MRLKRGVSNTSNGSVYKTIGREAGIEDSVLYATNHPNQDTRQAGRMPSEIVRRGEFSSAAVGI